MPATANTPALVVVSYYDRRPISYLQKLLRSMQAHAAGMPFKLCVVVNSTGRHEIELDSAGLDLDILYRENLGMNLGAWDHGWRQYDAYDNVLFLQDDCYLVRDNWLLAFVQQLQTPGLGMLGESCNMAWDIPWAQLREREAFNRLPEHSLNGVAANRIDVYLAALQRLGIAPGDSGLHMRSLVWALSHDTLKAIGGFPVGGNYGECIAAEIAVSRKLVSMGKKVSTVDAREFHYIRHSEWNQDYPGGPFNKCTTMAAQLAKLEQRNAQLMNAAAEKDRHIAQLEAELGLPRWKQIARWLSPVRHI